MTQVELLARGFMLPPINQAAGHAVTSPLEQWPGVVFHILKSKWHHFYRMRQQGKNSVMIRV